MWIWNKKKGIRDDRRIREAEQAAQDMDEKEQELRSDLDELYKTHQLNGITAHIVRSLRPRDANS